MLEAVDMPTLVAASTATWRLLLDVDVAVLGLERSGPGSWSTERPAALPPGEVDRLLGEGIDVVLYRAMEEDEHAVPGAAPGIVVRRR